MLFPEEGGVVNVDVCNRSQSADGLVPKVLENDELASAEGAAMIPAVNQHRPAMTPMSVLCWKDLSMTANVQLNAGSVSQPLLSSEFLSDSVHIMSALPDGPLDIMSAMTATRTSTRPHRRSRAFDQCTHADTAL